MVPLVRTADEGMKPVPFPFIAAPMNTTTVSLDDVLVGVGVAVISDADCVGVVVVFSGGIKTGGDSGAVIGEVVGDSVVATTVVLILDNAGNIEGNAVNNCDDDIAAAASLAFVLLVVVGIIVVNGAGVVVANDCPAGSTAVPGCVDGADVTGAVAVTISDALTICTIDVPVPFCCIPPTVFSAVVMV